MLGGGTGAKLILTPPTTSSSNALNASNDANDPLPYQKSSMIELFLCDALVQNLSIRTNPQHQKSSMIELFLCDAR